jgi:hypothetical protein
MFLYENLTKYPFLHFLYACNRQCSTLLWRKKYRMTLHDIPWVSDNTHCYLRHIHLSIDLVTSVINLHPRQFIFSIFNVYWTEFCSKYEGYLESRYKVQKIFVNHFFWDSLVALLQYTFIYFWTQSPCITMHLVSVGMSFLFQRHRNLKPALLAMSSPHECVWRHCIDCSLFSGVWWDTRFHLPSQYSPESRRDFELTWPF